VPHLSRTPLERRSVKATTHSEAAADCGGWVHPRRRPADGFSTYGVDYLSVLSSEESAEPLSEDLTVPLTDEETGTWDWSVMRDIPGGLSAEEMADDLGITSEVAALRLAGITALGLAHEVSPGRYRPGDKTCRSSAVPSRCCR
jgi:hypothetical protein